MGDICPVVAPGVDDDRRWIGIVATSSWPSTLLPRHGRPCAGHPRLRRDQHQQSWMARPSPAMTGWERPPDASLCWSLWDTPGMTEKVCGPSRTIIGVLQPRRDRRELISAPAPPFVESHLLMRLEVFDGPVPYAGGITRPAA